jgi:flagellar biosynthesis chaperone FliJ
MLDASKDKTEKMKDHLARQINQLERKLAKKQRALDDPKKQVDLSLTDLPGVLLRDSSFELKKFEAFQASRMIECFREKIAQMDANDKLQSTQIQEVLAAGFTR